MSLGGKRKYKDSKLVKFHCHGRHQLDSEYDKRKLISHGYDLGFKKCCICHCYFKTTTKVNCPCCNKQLQYKRRAPNRKYLNTGATKSINGVVEIETGITCRCAECFTDKPVDEEGLLDTVSHKGWICSDCTKLFGSE